MKKNITTLAELEREQEKLKMTMAITRQELARSIGTNRKELGSYLLKNVAIPAGLLGLGVAATKQLTSANEAPRKKQSAMGGLIKKLLPLGLNILQAYLLKRPDHTSEQTTATN